MNAAILDEKPGRLAKTLAILSLALFWLLPFSPMVAIGAVSKTRGTTSWARKIAVTGAILCSFYTALLACWLAWLVWQADLLRFGVG